MADMSSVSEGAARTNVDEASAASSGDVLRLLADWCSNLRNRLPGLVEVGIVSMEADRGFKLASSPETVPLERTGYREAIARMRAANVAVLLPLDRPEDGIVEIIAMPVKAEGFDTPVVLLVGIAEMPAARVQLIMAQLEISLGWVLLHLTQESVNKTKRDMDIYGKAFLLCAEVLDTKTPVEARQAMTSLVGSYFGCDRVVLVKRNLFGMKVQAISGETRFDRKSRLNDLTRQAAHEAQLRRSVVRWQRGDLDRTSIIGRLAEMHGDACAIAVPLTNSKGEIDEVIVLHWGVDDRVPDLEAWSVLWTLARPILEQKDSAARGAISKYLSAIKVFFKRLLGPRAFKLKALVFAALLVGFMSIFVRVDYVLRADVVIDDPDLRVISAPLDGFIEDVFVVPGDQVTVGQPLLQLEDDQIRLKIAELEAQIARYVAREAVARSNRDRAEAAVADAERAETEARLALSRQELSETTITARTAGVVLEGDLRQRRGARISFGEELMRIAPQQGIELKLSVRNRDAENLVKGLTGQVRLDARPENAVQVEIIRTKPGAETIDGELKFVAFGELRSSALLVENGMQGVARLDLGKAPIYHVWLTPIAETIYMFLWRWLP